MSAGSNTSIPTFLHLKSLVTDSVMIIRYVTHDGFAENELSIVDNANHQSP